MKTRSIAGCFRAIVLVAAVLAPGVPAEAQTDARCGATGYRVVAVRWDAVLRVNWELRQDCAHPGWPARMTAVFLAKGAQNPMNQGSDVGLRDRSLATAPLPAVAGEAVLVHAGDIVRLWAQDRMVRIEMNGMVEQPARLGERVVVRIRHQSDDAGLTVEEIDGVVRGAGNVEMER